MVEWAVTKRVELYDTSTIPSRLAEYSALETTIDAHLTLLGYNADWFAWLNQCANTWLQDLGPGEHCRWCGTVWLPGTLKCPSCGGTTEWNPRVIEYHQNAIPTGVEVRSSVRDVVRTDVDLRLLGDWQGTFKPMGLLLGEPGEWVCRFCGLYVKGETSSCPGCGGNRIPVSELEQIDRVCIYCGKRVRGGYACPACNGRLARLSRRIL